MTEKEKMLSGSLYNAHDEELSRDRLNARLLFQQINELGEEQKELRDTLLNELFGSAGKELWIEPPFYCDYGYNIHLGDNVFLNYNCCILDVSTVHIGDRVLIGPGVQIYTATHPMDVESRRSGLEYAKAIHIGNDVWIGGSAIICPGVTIGNGAVIGAGAVVTRDIPDLVFAAGNPARVIRKVPESD